LINTPALAAMLIPLQLPRQTETQGCKRQHVGPVFRPSTGGETADAGKPGSSAWVRSVQMLVKGQGTSH